MQSSGTFPPGSKYTNRQLSIATLLYLATLGGAEVCCLENLVGSFKTGKSFDALLVDIRTSTGNPALWAEDAVPGLDTQPLESKLERFMFCGDDRNIAKVYVQGRCIGGSQR
jgi:guanine deaminase